MNYRKCCGNCKHFITTHILPDSICKNYKKSGNMWVRALDDHDCSCFVFGTENIKPEKDNDTECQKCGSNRLASIEGKTADCIIATI